MSAAARPASRLANSPASGGGFDRPQMAIIIGLEWRLPPACATKRSSRLFRAFREALNRAIRSAGRSSIFETRLAPAVLRAALRVATRSSSSMAEAVVSPAFDVRDRSPGELP